MKAAQYRRVRWGAIERLGWQDGMVVATSRVAALSRSNIVHGISNRTELLYGGTLVLVKQTATTQLLCA